MRLVFAGTPDVAVPALRTLLGSGHEVAAVLTRPDARAGRGRTLVPSPVKRVALDAGIEVLDPPRADDPAFLERLREIAPDACPIVAYGGLVRPDALAVPRLGWVNLHFSLLPRWRGAAPVQRAIIAGDARTGVSAFVLEAGLDTGPVLVSEETAIGDDETSGDLLTRLAERGAPLLLAALDGLADGTITPRPQPAEGVTHAAKIDVDDARIDWAADAPVVDRLVRGCTPAPGAWTTFRGERVKLGPLAPASVSEPACAPGELAPGKKSVRVGTGRGDLLLGTVQAPGKKPMPAADWARGQRVTAGERFEA